LSRFKSFSGTRSLRRRSSMQSRVRRCYGRATSEPCRGAVLVCQRSHAAALKLLASCLLRGAGVRRHTAEAGGELLGALQCSSALFETDTVLPKLIVKGRIALDRLSTASTFVPLECIAELHHASSNTPGTRGGTPKRGCRLLSPHGDRTALSRDDGCVQ